MGNPTTHIDELKTLLSYCSNINSKSEKASLYSTLLQLQEHSSTDASLLEALTDSSDVLLSAMATSIADDDEEIAAQALKCMGFMIYHPSIVTGISGDDANMVLSSLHKVILSTQIKSVCNLGVWCISVQQFSAKFLNAHIDSLVRAIVHALDNPTGSLSTTFEAMQAVMKLASQANEKMQETSNLWAPPIYRRLVSADKREKDMSERCLLKIKSTICPPPIALSKVVIVDIKRKLLPALEGLLKQGMKIQTMQAWGWFTRLIGPHALKNRHLINQLLKIPEQTFSDNDPQVKIASQIAWEALIDALVVLPTQEATTQQTYEDNDSIFEANGLKKSIKLIMTPLIGTMSSKCDSSVHLSCLNTWNYFLHKLDAFLNCPFVIKTVLEPVLEVVFRIGPDGRNIWSWNFCVDLINNYALARQIDVNKKSDDELANCSWKHYSVKWMPWSLNQFNFFINMVHILVSHGETGTAAGLKIFRSSLKGVQFNLTSSNVPYNEVMQCIDTIIQCLKKISESDSSRRFLEFIEVVTEEVQPSILGSPLYNLKLETKFSENLEIRSDDNAQNMVSPVEYLMVLYYHAVANSISDAGKLSSYMTLLLALYDPYDILHTFTCLLYKYSTPDSLEFWIATANCLKGQPSHKSDPDDTWVLAISRFLAYPFSVFSSVSQGKLNVIQINKTWKSVYESSQCGEKLFPVFDQFLEEYSKVDETKKTKGHEFLSLCGDAVISVLENTLESSASCKNNDHTRFSSIKTSLQCAVRFLNASHAEAKANRRFLDTTSRVFSVLVRIVESFHFNEDIIPFVKILSVPLLEWLSDLELQHENTIHQPHRLWTTVLKCMQTSWPPLSFNSTLLKLQTTLLEATLDHQNPSISDPTIAFWNCTYGEQTKLDYPHNLLPVLHRLSRNGRINLCKKRFSGIDAVNTPPQQHKVTTMLNRGVKRVELMDGRSGSKRKKLELTERQKEVRRAQQGRSKDCEGRGPGIRTYTSVDFSQGNEEESQEESQELRNAEAILEMLKRDGKLF